MHLDLLEHALRREAETNCESKTKKNALATLVRFPGQDFGYDVEKWLQWFLIPGNADAYDRAIIDLYSDEELHEFNLTFEKVDTSEH